MALAFLLVEGNPCHLVSHAELQGLTVSTVGQEQKLLFRFHSSDSCFVKTGKQEGRFSKPLKAIPAAELILRMDPAFAPADPANLLATHGRVESTVTLRRPQRTTRMPSEFQTGPRRFQELAGVYGTPSEGSPLPSAKDIRDNRGVCHNIVVLSGILLAARWGRSSAARQSVRLPAMAFRNGDLVSVQRCRHRPCLRSQPRQRRSLHPGLRHNKGATAVTSSPPAASESVCVCVCESYSDALRPPAGCRRKRRSWSEGSEALLAPPSVLAREHARFLRPAAFLHPGILVLQLFRAAPSSYVAEARAHTRTCPLTRSTCELRPLHVPGYTHEHVSPGGQVVLTFLSRSKDGKRRWKNCRTKVLH